MNPGLLQRKGLRWAGSRVRGAGFVGSARPTGRRPDPDACAPARTGFVEMRWRLLCVRNGKCCRSGVRGLTGV